MSHREYLDEICSKELRAAEDAARALWDAFEQMDWLTTAQRMAWFDNAITNATDEMYHDREKCAAYAAAMQAKLPIGIVSMTEYHRLQHEAEKAYEAWISALSGDEDGYGDDYYDSRRNDAVMGDR